MSDNIYHVSSLPPRPSTAHKPFHEYTRDGEYLSTRWIDTRAMIGRSEKTGVYRITFTEETTNPILTMIAAKQEQKGTPLFPIVIQHLKQEHEALLYAYGVSGEIILQYLYPADTKYGKSDEAPDARVIRICARVVQDALNT